MQALVALHGFWVMALVPPVVIVVRRLPANVLKCVGLSVAAVGVLGLVAVAGHVVAYWEIDTPTRKYLLRRIAYVIATMTDVPLVQVTVAGLVCYLVGRARGTRDRASRSPNNENLDIPGREEV